MRSAFVFALLALAAASQPAQNRPETVIRTTTRLVEVRVMAEDWRGGAVTDLRRDEFKVQDNGKAQTITAFSFEGGGGPAAANAASAGQSPTGGRDDYAVILLDWLNPRYADRVAVRDAVNKLLRDFQPRQRVALYVLGRPPRFLHSFTFDSAELLDILARTDEEPEDPFDPAKPAQLDGRMKTWVTLTVEERLLRFNTNILDTIGALEKITGILARLPGRKAIIWATNGFPIVLDERAVPGFGRGTVSYVQHVEPLIEHLNRANVTLHTLDARGMRGEPVGLQPYGDIGTLQELASRTGGTSYSERNDLAAGMRQALEDGKISYTLGFSVPLDAKPGLHEISLRTTRPRVKLRYRKSYQLDDGSSPGVRRY
jgi:VWFA-related protein